MIMKKTLLILVILCAYTFAMAPRHRIPRETQVTICDPETPCSWDVYKETTKIIYKRILNSYCKCASDMICAFDGDNASARVYEYRCKTPNIK